MYMCIPYVYIYIHTFSNCTGLHQANFAGTSVAALAGSTVVTHAVLLCACICKPFKALKVLYLLGVQRCRLSLL